MMIDFALWTGPNQRMTQHLVAPSLLALVTTALLLSSNISLCDSEAQTVVEQQCKLGLNFKSIREFRQFIEEFLQLSREQLQARKSLSLCARDSEAIRALDRLITTKDVCDMQRIDDLVAYHKEYFVKKGLWQNRKPITYKFFTRYAVQVAFVCKRNLFKNLELAREELKDQSKVLEEAKERVYNDEPSIKSNIKLIEEQPDDPATSNVKPQDEAELTLSEYREALTQLRQPEDILTFDTEECRHKKGRDTLISKDKVQTFFKPALMCHQLHRYYAGSLLSIAKLANVGYMAPQKDIDDRLAESPMIRDWIIAVQVCEPMLHMKASGETRGEMVVVDTCSEKISAIEPLVFEDSIEDLDNDLLDELVPKSEATRHQAQKIMRTTMKKMAKIDLVKQLKSGSKNKRSIFKSSLAITLNRGGLLSPSPPRGLKQASVPRNLLSKFSVELAGGRNLDLSNGVDIGAAINKEAQLSDREAYDTLMEVVANSGEQTHSPVSEENEIDKPVAFDLMSSVASTLVVMAIMMVFEWIFFIVMTVAARICHELYFNFEDLLTFPPKVLSWSDADFARYTNELENTDEDDFFDYEELTSDEQHQRDLLARVFGKPPPMLFRY